MRVALISTYPPRPCGIGTFSADLRAALLDADPTVTVDVAAIVREDSGRSERPEVAVRIRQDVRSDYPAAARALAERGADVAVVEHEYGIFGGEDGAYVLSLVDELSIPYVVTLHTVLSEPSEHQARVLRELCAGAALVTVFTETARRMVVGAGLVPDARVRVVPHGGPSELLPRNGGPPSVQAAAPAVRPALEVLDGRTVLSTFGLISAGKGIEQAISALPAVVERHPEVLYLVAGQTHPEVVKAEGERYRLSLERLVRDLGLDEHVHFLQRFLTVTDLADLLHATDIYLTPYRSREQIVSGALTFAVVAGCPVVSTPYYYAEDLLADGAGRLVPFGDSDAMATAVLELLDDPAALSAARAAARDVGEKLAWPAVGVQLAAVLREVVADRPTARPAPRLVTRFTSPALRPDHLLTLVDDVGILQHADGVLPRRSTGYCVDDMARLVIVAVALHQPDGDHTVHRMLAQGLSFLRYAWDPAAGGMRNFMSYDRRWLDAPHLGDHVGRTVWALGSVLAAEPPRAVAAPSRRMLDEMLPALDRLTSPRSVAFAILGLARPQPSLLGPDAEALLRRLADRLAAGCAQYAGAGWTWFEDVLAYDNARLPQALIAGGHRLGDGSLVRTGLETLSWYDDQGGPQSGPVRLVGHRGRRRGDPLPADGDVDDGDEQPLEAAALVEAHVTAYLATGDGEHARRALRTFEWFLGRNRLGVPVYDFATGGCHDGLGREAVNDNEGAESTLAFLQAWLALDAAGLQASVRQW